MGINKSRSLIATINLSMATTSELIPLSVYAARVYMKIKKKRLGGLLIKLRPWYWLYKRQGQYPSTRWWLASICTNIRYGLPCIAGSQSWI